jgi:hypothetical protein
MSTHQNRDLFYNTLLYENGTKKRTEKDMENARLRPLHKPSRCIGRNGDMQLHQVMPAESSMDDHLFLAKS